MAWNEDEDRIIRGVASTQEAEAYVQKSRDLAKELARIATFPEMEWARVTAVVMQLIAKARRTILSQDDGKAAVQVVDAGKVYVDRLLAQRDLAREALGAQCIDHANNACAAWCDACQDGERLRHEVLEDAIPAVTMRTTLDDFEHDWRDHLNRRHGIDCDYGCRVLHPIPELV